jgi:hypothetical protein
VWLNGNINPTRTISSSSSYPYNIFVTIAGDIYVGNSIGSGEVDKWTSNATIGVAVMNAISNCYGIFVDISSNLYCSAAGLNQVVKRWLNDSSMTVTAVAGTGVANSASNTLNSPRGIFVDINFDLYVADYYNNRIQLFHLGQSIGVTVAGNGASGIITLYYPTGVVLDADNYLFIVDSYNHRIVGSGPSGFRCIVGCSGGGSAPNQLLYPQTMAFDSYGNIFVTDQNNNRIQKFVLDANSCGKRDII